MELLCGASFQRQRRQRRISLLSLRTTRDGQKGGQHLPGPTVKSEVLQPSRDVASTNREQFGKLKSWVFKVKKYTK